MKQAFNINDVSLVSVIIPVYNDVAGLVVTLRSIAQMKSDLRREVIVCNDGGPAAISDVTARHGCREVRLPSNAGSYAARNAGLEVAKGDVIAFTDADQAVAPDWLDAGVSALMVSDYVGGRVVVISDVESDAWIRYDKARAFPVERYIEQGFAPTANLFIRRTVLDRVPEFNSGLRSGGDYEFGLRVKAAGLSQQYAANVITYHPARDRMQQLSKLRRVATGHATIRVRINGERRYALALTALKDLLLAPLELLWRIFLHTVSRPSETDALSFVVIEKVKKLVRSYWLLAAAASMKSSHSVVAGNG